MSRMKTVSCGSVKVGTSKYTKITHALVFRTFVQQGPEIWCATFGDENFEGKSHNSHLFS